MKLFELYDYASARSISWHATLKAAVKAQVKARSKVVESVTEETRLVLGVPTTIRVITSPSTLLIYDVLGCNLADVKHPLHKTFRDVYSSLGYASHFKPRTAQTLYVGEPSGKYILHYTFRLGEHSRHYSVEAAAKEAARQVNILHGSHRNKFVCIDPHGRAIGYQHPEYAAYAAAFTVQFQKVRRV